MKKYSFPAYVRFGKMDNAETVVDVWLTREESDYLEKCAASGSYFRLSECTNLSEISKKVYDIANDQITEELRLSDKEFGTGYCDYACGDDEWKAGDTYEIGVNFPTHLQMLMEEE